MLLGMFLATSLLAADATGRWTGTFTPSDGNAGPALLILQQDGDKLTGTAGPDRETRRQIQNGKAENGNLSFSVDSGNSVMKFVLKQEGDERQSGVTRERDGCIQTAKLAVKREK